MKSMCYYVLKLKVLWVGEGLWGVPSLGTKNLPIKNKLKVLQGLPGFSYIKNEIPRIPHCSKF